MSHVHYVFLATFIAGEMARLSTGQTISILANKHEYRELCKILALERIGITLQDLSSPPSEDINLVMDINMSLSNPSWQDMFVKDKSKGELHANSADAKQKGEDYDGQWAAWLEARKRIEKAKQTTAFKGLNLDDLKDYQKQKLRRHVQAVAEQVATAAGNFVPADSEEGKLTSDAVTQTLREAAYSDKKATERDVKTQQAFGSAMTNQARENDCTTNTGGTAGNSVLATEACLCLKPKGGTDVKGACAMTLDGSWTWQNSHAAPTVDDIRKLSKYCNGGTTAQQHGQLLRAAIDNIAASVIKGDADAYLGAFQATNCNGQNNRGVCVELKAGAKDADGGLIKLTWYATLNTLAECLIRREAAEKSNNIATKKFKK
uniref:Variant surface glycoprotein 1525 n=1 Tax=Trypanosoma brucei TaxID=5691 RepID=M4SYN7_9TRYP|nr:variant surface glycoprotein 1525 [Trypanosoma brucei]